MSSYKNIINKLEYPKFACFDLDYTLIKPKSGKKFPVDKNDWEWMYPNVPNKLREYYENRGYTLLNNYMIKEFKITKKFPIFEYTILSTILVIIISIVYDIYYI